jgi:hypothetical protein
MLWRGWRAAYRFADARRHISGVCTLRKFSRLKVKIQMKGRQEVMDIQLAELLRYYCMCSLVGCSAYDALAR